MLNRLMGDKLIRLIVLSRGKIDKSRKTAEKPRKCRLIVPSEGWCRLMVEGLMQEEEAWKRHHDRVGLMQAIPAD